MAIRTWEIDFELRMRRTLTVPGPSTEAEARAVAEVILANGVELSSFLKWTDGRAAYRPMPVETVVDNAPTIVAVREV